MADQSVLLARSYHEGAVVPDRWTPVTVGGVGVGTELKNCVALRFGTGGASVSVIFANDPDLTVVTFTMIADGETIDGRFRRVTAATGPANIMAALAT